MRRLIGHICAALGHWTQAPRSDCTPVLGASSPTSTCEERAHELELPGFTRRTFLSGMAAVLAASQLPRIPGAPEGDFDSTLALWKEYGEAQLMKPGQLVRVGGIDSTALGELLEKIYTPEAIRELQQLESPLWSRITSVESGGSFVFPVPYPTRENGYTYITPAGENDTPRRGRLGAWHTAKGPTRRVRSRRPA